MCPQQASVLWTAVAASGAMASAAVAAVYTAITMRLVRIQSEAKVIVYVRHDLDRPSILVITIENIGRDIAHDVKFTASRPIPARAFGLTAREAKDASTMDSGPLVVGIPALGPGDRRDITWGQFGGLTKALADGPIQLQYSYHSGRRRLTGLAALEVGSFDATDASEKPIVAAAHSLKRIADDTKAIASSLSRGRTAPAETDDVHGT